MTGAIVLTEKQRDELLKVFGHFSSVVQRVDVYGSRARGDAYVGSDVDLVIDGQVDYQTLLSISGALDDSYLSIFADVTAYNCLQPETFARRVRRDAVTLFTADDLAEAPSFMPVEGMPEWYRPSNASAA